MSKPCITCKQALPLSAFYAHPHMKDGHSNLCKECQKANAIVRDRLRADQPHRVAARKAYAKTHKPNPASNKAWRERNPEKYKAHTTLNNAIKAGKVVPPLTCEECCSMKIHAHHDDYSKPLEVRWLCALCHGKIHRNQRDLPRYPWDLP